MMKVLVIDDSYTSRSVTKNVFELHGASVIEAANGEEGFTMYYEHNPQIIILDLLMPVMDGFQFLERFRNEGLQATIIVITADLEKDVKETCLDYGVDGFLYKPFDWEKCKKLIKKHL